MEEVDDFEADLEAVDVVSFALAVVVSLGSNAVVSGSILAATATVTRRRGVLCIVASFFFLVQRGHMPCPHIQGLRDCNKNISQPDAWW